jgi:hypothetical protein
VLGLVKTLPAQEKEQTQSDQIYSSIFREEITLLTDRTIYATGEEILFKAAYTKDISTEKRLSTVLYIELIKPDGASIKQAKFPLRKDEIAGGVHIPENAITGEYYLKAYTKWMRNYPAESYAYQQIKIINPSDATVNKTANVKSDAAVFTEVEKMQKPVLSTDKASYSTREEVNVSLQGDQAMDKNYGYCISVVKQGAKDLSKSWIKSAFQVPGENELANYYPEIKGVTISGKVWDDTHKQPVNNALVSMTLLSNTAYLLCSETNEKGEFFLSLPEKEQVHDIFINAEKENKDLTIEIDKDFCTKPIHLNTTKFYLSEEEKSLASEICINAQIARAFNEVDDSNSAEQNNHQKLSFYGTAQKVFYTKDYINVKTLRDFTMEIIREVKVIKDKLVPSIQSSQTNSFRFQPFLVMLDNIPISDEATFLAISTSKIDRVELNNLAYIVGNRSYCGIINAFSKNNDMAGIELPKNSMFFKYSLLDESKLNSTSNRSDIHLPDRRNCLYWNPNMKIAAGKANQFSFFTSDVPGEYQIILQAISKTNGNPVYFEKNFRVE